MIKKLMFRQHWQTMLNKCYENGPVQTGDFSIGSSSPTGMVIPITSLQAFLIQDRFC